MADQIEQMGVVLENHQKVCLCDTNFYTIYICWLLIFVMFQFTELIFHIANRNLRICKINIMSKFGNALI